MDNRLFERSILNSPYEYPTQYWELDAEGQPTQKIIETRRPAEFITPIPCQESETEKPSSGSSIAVKVINHLGDEVMKVFRVS